jgi:hypothetical protein
VIFCRIGCSLGQKSAFALARRNKESSYDNITSRFALLAVRPHAAWHPNLS